MVNKKIVIIVTIIAILVVGAIVGYCIMSLQKTEYTFNDKTSESNEIVEGNLATNNTVAENVTDENVDTKNNTEQNTTEQNATTTDSAGNSNEALEAKAKALAKEKWGEDDQNVYYYLEEQLSQNVYVISVRSKETTAVLIDYEINLETGEVSEY